MTLRLPVPASWFKEYGLSPGHRNGSRWGKTGFPASSGAVALLLVLLLGMGGCGDAAPPAQQSFNRGTRLMNQGELDQAIEAYKEGLRLEPGSAVGRNLLGMAYRMKFNEERDLRWKELELDAFREAVAVDSTYWPACINLGATLYFQGDHHEASRWFRRALELNPDNPERERIEGMIEDTGKRRTD